MAGSAAQVWAALIEQEVLAAWVADSESGMLADWRIGSPLAMS